VGLDRVRPYPLHAAVGLSAVGAAQVRCQSSETARVLSGYGWWTATRTATAAGSNPGLTQPLVSEDYKAADKAFTGKVRWVQIDTDEAAEDPDHTISPAERFLLAMAVQ
jgi:hypothetical protein